MKDFFRLYLLQIAFLICIEFELDDVRELGYEHMN